MLDGNGKLTLPEEAKVTVVSAVGAASHQGESYKLYARDVAGIPLSADLSDALGMPQRGRVTRRHSPASP